MIVPSIGDKSALSLHVTSGVVEQFAGLTGDTNPVHLDEAYAAATRFGRRIAHGMLGGGLISAVLGTRLPGPGCIYLSQHLEFKAPIYVGDDVTAEVEVIAVRPDKPILTMRTTCTRSDGTMLITGEAVVFLPKD